MKVLLITGVFFFLLSCKDDKQEKMEGIYKAEAEKLSDTSINHQSVWVYKNNDTSIHQSVWLYKNKYVLQTVVNTERQQNALSNYKEFQAFIEGDRPAPYNIEIIGTFDFIKNNKRIEYNKADSFVKDLRLKAARDSIAFKATLKGKMEDSAELLNKLKP